VSDGGWMATENQMEGDHEKVTGGLAEALTPREFKPQDQPKETVNHPAHYNEHPSGVECIDVVEHFSFNTGNAIKYLWRAGLKGDDPREDLLKARWYVERELQRLEQVTGAPDVSR
jgi:hypothetical protein